MVKDLLAGNNFPKPGFIVLTVTLASLEGLSRRACRARLGELRDRQDLAFARWTLSRWGRSTDFIRDIRRARHALRRLCGTAPA